MAEHFRDRGWNDTLFHGFLNNKVDFKKNGWSRGSSVWLLDEPASFQDFWALRYFALAFHEGVNQARRHGGGDGRVAPAASSSDRFPRMVFRADISRPQWRRDVLDGLLDYHVVGSAMREYPRLVFDRKRALGEIVVEYGGTNPVTASNLQPVSWSLDAWTLGADGVLPWQTVGNAESWRKGDELALFYPLPGHEGRRHSVGPSQGLPPRPAGCRVPDALGTPARPAAVGGGQTRFERRFPWPAPARRPRPEAPRMPAGSTTPGFAPRTSGPCGRGSARLFPRLIPGRYPASSSFAPRRATPPPRPVLENEWFRFREN